MVEIVATSHRQNTGNKFSDLDSRLAATRASGATARRRRREMRAGSGWPHVGHLLVAVIRIPSLCSISTVSRPTTCRRLAKIVRTLPDRLTLFRCRPLSRRAAGSQLIVAASNEHRACGNFVTQSPTGSLRARPRTRNLCRDRA